MGDLTADQLRAILDKKHNIRNVALIAPAGHGKSTLTGSLVAASGCLPGTLALYYKGDDEYLLNLSDSRDTFGGTDGALMVVDCVERVGPQTEVGLYQALGERVRPVLAVNKIDKCFLELGMDDGEQAYQTFRKVVEDANAVMAAHQDPKLGDAQVLSPEKGNVTFASGLHGWGFSIAYFAKKMASGLGFDVAKVSERLWGEHFIDPSTMSWSRKKTESPWCVHGFVWFCYMPIKRVIDLCMKDEKDELWPLLQKLGVNLTAEEKDLNGEALMKRVMQTWLPVSNTLSEMMIHHLPSPADAKAAEEYVPVPSKSDIESEVLSIKSPDESKSVQVDTEDSSISKGKEKRELSESLQKLRIEQSLKRKRKPIVIIVLGETGNGKTTLVHKLLCHSRSSTYVINLDPAATTLPFDVNIDIRDIVDSKEVEREQPDNRISVTLDLFSAKVDEVVSSIERQADRLDYVLVDTSRKMEFCPENLSAIAEAFASTYPTVAVYVVDTPRSRSAFSFYRGLQFVCGKLHKTGLPVVLAFNKTDVVRHQFALEWVEHPDIFRKELDYQQFYRKPSLYHFSPEFDEICKNLRSVGVSAISGAGMDDFFKAIEEGADEFMENYEVNLDKRREANRHLKEMRMFKQKRRAEREKLRKDMEKLRKDSLEKSGDEHRRRSMWSSNNMITLKSSDGRTFKIEKRVVLQWMRSIKSTLEEGWAEEAAIPLPQVSGSTLHKVIEYCNEHAKVRESESLSAWDADFVKVDMSDLQDLILAADVLQIQDLLSLACSGVAEMIRGKTLEEMKDMLMLSDYVFV